MHDDHDPDRSGIDRYDLEDRADPPLPLPVRVRCQELPPQKPEPQAEAVWRLSSGSFAAADRDPLRLLSGLPSAAKTLWVGYEADADGTGMADLRLWEARGGASRRSVDFSIASGDLVAIDCSDGATMSVEITALTASGRIWASTSAERRSPDAPNEAYQVEVVGGAGLRRVPARAVSVTPKAAVQNWEWATRRGATVESIPVVLEAAVSVDVIAPLYDAGGLATLLWKIRL